MTDTEAIYSAIRGFVAAYERQDLDSILAYYTDDLVKLRSGGPSESKPELARRIAETFQTYETKLDAGVDEIEVGGSLGYVRGTLRVTLTPRNGGEDVTIARRYLEIWRKVDERWLVARTMDNSE